MAGRIYLLGGESKLIAMEEAPYDSETLLQRLLADHSDLLDGDQINAEEPRRWLLVSREMAVPGELDGAGRRSLDHLFLDQDAIPTLVEVKRSTDSRIRREVIGQMLDYAANAVAYWPVEEIKDRFLERGEFRVAHRIPYSDLESLGEEERSRMAAQDAPLEFGHTLADQICGQLVAGFVLTGFYEDIDPGTILGQHIPSYLTTKSVKPR